MNGSKYGTIEKIRILGDDTIAVMYLPFSRKKAKELIKFAEQFDNPVLSRLYKIDNDNVLVSIQLSFQIITITIQTEKVRKRKKLYRDGVSRYNVIKNGALKEFYSKDGTSFSDLVDYDISPNSFIQDLGYAVGDKTQYSFIHSGNYTGLMKYAIQNMLGINEQIGYKYGFYETDGLLLERVDFDTFLDTFQDKNNIIKAYYKKQKSIDLRNIKISQNGVFIRKAKNTVYPNVEFDYNNPGFCGQQSIGDINKFGNFYQRVFTDNSYFQNILDKTDFIIPSKLSDYVYDDETTYQLLDSSVMSEFYSKQPFYNSCGWLFSPKVTESKSEFTERGLESTFVYNALNTCRDDTKSYLYCIRIICKHIYFSETFKQSNEYLTNEKYKEQKNYCFEYTASLHKLLEGRLATLETSGLSFLEGNSGLYLPDEQENKTKLFNINGLPRNLSRKLEFAPVHIIEGNHTSNYFDRCVLSYFYNSEFNFNGFKVNGNFCIPGVVDFDNVGNPITTTEEIELTCSGLRDILTGSSYYSETTSLTTINNDILNAQFKQHIKDIFKNIITNNIVSNFRLSSTTSSISLIGAQTTVDLSGITSFSSYVSNYPTNDNHKCVCTHTNIGFEDTENTYYETKAGIISHLTENGSNFGFAEKVIVPMDNRNSIVCIYTGLNSLDVINTEDVFNSRTFRRPLYGTIIKTEPSSLDNENYLDEHIRIETYLKANYYFTYDILKASFIADLKPFEKFLIYPYRFPEDGYNYIPYSGDSDKLNRYYNYIMKIKYPLLYAYKYDFFENISGAYSEIYLTAKYYLSQKLNDYIKQNEQYIDLRMPYNPFESMVVYLSDDTVNVFEQFKRNRYDFAFFDDGLGNITFKPNYYYTDFPVYVNIDNYEDFNFIGRA